MELKAMVISTVITIIIWFPFMVRQIKRGGYKRKGDIIIEEAEKAGRIVEATLKWKRFSYGEYGHPDPRIRSDTWLFAYQYTINGKKYTYRSSSTEMPPDTMLLYYPEGKPHKAIPRGHFVVGAKMITLILLPVFIWAAVYHLLS
ncbi:MAG: hypothetical protein IJW77_12050 [Clostridia bacterium]|nr:hypothetical protein [Clostridia bacterium]